MAYCLFYQYLSKQMERNMMEHKMMTILGAVIFGIMAALCVLFILLELLPRLVATLLG